MRVAGDERVVADDEHRLAVELEPVEQRDDADRAGDLELASGVAELYLHAAICGATTPMPDSWRSAIRRDSAGLGRGAALLAGRAHDGLGDHDAVARLQLLAQQHAFGASLIAAEGRTTGHRESAHDRAADAFAQAARADASAPRPSSMSQRRTPETDPDRDRSAAQIRRISTTVRVFLRPRRRPNQNTATTTTTTTTAPTVAA